MGVVNKRGGVVEVNCTWFVVLKVLECLETKARGQNTDIIGFRGG